MVTELRDCLPAAVSDVLAQLTQLHLRVLPFICGADTRIECDSHDCFPPCCTVSTCITKDFSVDTLEDANPTLQAGELRQSTHRGLLIQASAGPLWGRNLLACPSAFPERGIRTRTANATRSTVNYL